MVEKHSAVINFCPCHHLSVRAQGPWSLVSPACLESDRAERATFLVHKLIGRATS